MTVTGKFALITFVVLPIGFFGSAILLQGHDPWAFIAVCASVIFSLLLLWALKCPRCHCRVYQTKYWPLARMDLYYWGILLHRCGNCGYDLDRHDESQNDKKG